MICYNTTNYAKEASFSHTIVNGLRAFRDCEKFIYVMSLNEITVELQLISDTFGSISLAILNGH